MKILSVVDLLLLELERGHFRWLVVVGVAANLFERRRHRGECAAFCVLAWWMRRRDRDGLEINRRGRRRVGRRHSVRRQHVKRGTATPHQKSAVVMGCLFCFFFFFLPSKRTLFGAGSSFSARVSRRHEMRQSTVHRSADLACRMFTLVPAVRTVRT